MARIRTIKPEFWKSEQVVDCSRDARLLFIGMLNFADDRGVLKFRARTIKSEVFPEDEDISSRRVVELVVELCRNGLVGIFNADGSDYIHILTFTNHQRVEKPTYKHPKPPSAPAGYVDWSAPDRGTVGDLFDDASATEGKGTGREGKGTGRRQPDSGSSNGSATGSPPSGGVHPGGENSRDQIFGRCLEWLTNRSGKKTTDLRGLLGRWCRDHGDDRTLEVLQAAMVENPGDPVPWCQAAFKTRANGVHRPAPRGFGARSGIGSGDFVPTPEPWAERYREFRSGGRWISTWGPAPGERGCDLPPEIRAKVDSEFDAKQGV